MLQPETRKMECRRNRYPPPTCALPVSSTETPLLNANFSYDQLPRIPVPASGRQSQCSYKPNVRGFVVKSKHKPTIYHRDWNDSCSNRRTQQAQASQLQRSNAVSLHIGPQHPPNLAQLHGAQPSQQQNGIGLGGTPSPAQSVGAKEAEKTLVQRATGGQQTHEVLSVQSSTPKKRGKIMPLKAVLGE